MTLRNPIAKAVKQIMPKIIPDKLRKKQVELSCKEADDAVNERFSNGGSD